MKAIVTDVRYRMSLPIIRSLGKKGVEITCAERKETQKSSALGFHSKYTKNTIRLPNPSDEDGFFAALEGLSTEEHPVLIPVGMDTLTALSRRLEFVEKKFSVAIPPIESLEIANDKAAVIDRAAELGVPHPETTSLRDGELIEALAMRVKLPSVIKYRAGELLQLDPKDRYCIVNTREEFVMRYYAMNDVQERPLVQEYVSGEGFGVSVVMDKAHNPITVFCHRRLHEYPISGGPSCLCESAWNSELAEYAVKLLRSLKWVGVAMVEFKGTSEGGYMLMEINPRLWGSLALAPIAGCDIGDAIVKAAQGEQACMDLLSPNYKVGKRMRFLIQDILAFFPYFKKAKNKLTFTLKYIATLFDIRTRGGVFSFSDPKPAFKYLGVALKKKDKIIR